MAVLGISPAILTETIWALAHEAEPFIPERVVALTTTTGRACIQRALFDSGGWDRLIRALEKKGLPAKGRLRFGAAGDHIRLFPRADGRGDLEDIVTAEESMTAADFILRALREYTENPDSRIVASLAGGRKTMGALLTSCMTLLGRTQDRLVHVLINSPYDSPKLQPPFLFPEKGLKHRDPSSDKLVPSPSAEIELTEIPFVRMRGWYEREYRKAPASFMAMVRRFQDLAPEAANYPELVIDMPKGRVVIGDRVLALSPSEMAILCVIAERWKAGIPLSTWADLDVALKTLHDLTDVDSRVVWLHDFVAKPAPDPKEDTRKFASSLRTKIRAALPVASLAEALVPILKGTPVETYPAKRIRITPLPDVIRRRKPGMEVNNA